MIYLATFFDNDYNICKNYSLFDLNEEMKDIFGHYQDYEKLDDIARSVVNVELAKRLQKLGKNKKTIIYILYTDKISKVKDTIKKLLPKRKIGIITRQEDVIHLNISKEDFDDFNISMI